ncbi:MlaD family protein [Shewanella maritima]|uniref:MlaD family protein n=1 Tax=Shewanella maritima TaxID=2520507 RepID=UPI003735F704
MTQSESPKVVNKKLFSPIWLLPIIALVLGGWLTVKSIKEAGVEISIHFPNATGMEIGKTLVKYQGLTVGKVTDISLDDQLRGVDVKVVMDYRAEAFLRQKSQFWLVKPKASITGVEGLDTLFSGNYITIQPGKGEYTKDFVAEREAPPIQPGTDGLTISLIAPKLGSLDVGSPIFYRQVPVGNVVSYKLDGNQRIIITAFIQEQYAHLVKTGSHFWNVSGLKVDASLSGISVNTESIASILAGGISFSSEQGDTKARNGSSFTLFDNIEQANGGIKFQLLTDNSHNLSQGTQIVYRGMQVGEVKQTTLHKDQVIVDATIFTEFQPLLTSDSYMWLEGADISFDGVNHLSRLITGHVINILPGNSHLPIETPLPLYVDAPDLLASEKLNLTVTTEVHTGIKVGSEVRYRQLPIGEVTQVDLAPDFSQVEYRVQILPEFKPLLTKDSYFISESAIHINANLEELEVKTRDVNTMLNGAITLVPGQSKTLIDDSGTLTLFASESEAKLQKKHDAMHVVTLQGIDGADLTEGSPVYYKKMRIGEVSAIEWRAKKDVFDFTLHISEQYKQLINERTVYWRNSAVKMNASLKGVDIDVAPLAGAIKGSIAIGLLDDAQQAYSSRSNHLHDSQKMAFMQASLLKFSLPADARIADNAPIRYKGHEIGFIDNLTLNHDLDSLSANAYIFGEYAAHFIKQDTEFFLVDARISLAGIEAPETLLTGAYIGALPGKTNSQSSEFTVKLESSFDANVPKNATRLTLIDEQLGSLKVGTPIFYRGINIGQIDGYRLTDDGTQILIYAHVEHNYSHLINTSSKFWDASGIKLNVGLFSGAQIETGSLETLLAGGISVVTQDVSTADNAIKQTDTFLLFNKMMDKWQDWKPEQVKPAP